MIPAAGPTLSPSTPTGIPHDPFPFHIAIAGAGLGGLCLAQALKRRGIAFDVYEQDAAPDSRTQGYRIRIDRTGQAALADSLPPAQYQLFLQTCSRSQSAGQFLDPRLSPVAGRPSDTWSDTDAGDDGDDGDRSAHRQTLRQILMLGIEDRVHFGQGVNGYREPDDGGVLLTLADGATRRTDALVGADGVNSAIRRLRLPHAAPADTGSACIYGKTPLDAALDSRLTSATSVIFGPDYAIVVDPMRFRFPTQAGALTPVADYLYWAVIGGRDALGPDSRDGAALLQRLGAMLEAGADGLRAMFNRADAASVSMLPVRSAPDLAPWPASRVTLLGDAIHAMSPAGGVGANTALDDAAGWPGTGSRRAGRRSAGRAGRLRDGHAPAPTPPSRPRRRRASWPAPSPEAAAPKAG